MHDLDELLEPLVVSGGDELAFDQLLQWVTRCQHPPRAESEPGGLLGELEARVTGYPPWKRSTVLWVTWTIHASTSSAWRRSAASTPWKSRRTDRRMLS